MMDHRLADLIGLSVNRLINKNATFPSLSEAYPHLLEEGRSEKKDWRVVKQRLLQYAEANNSKRRSK